MFAHCSGMHVQGVVGAGDAGDWKCPCCCCCCCTTPLLQIEKSLHLQHPLEPTSAALAFSRALVREGACVAFKQGQFGVKGKAIGDFIKAAAPYAHLLVQPPDVAGALGKPCLGTAAQGHG